MSNDHVGFCDDLAETLAESDVRVDIDELAQTVDNDVGDKPAKPRYLPRYISDHPDFK